MNHVKGTEREAQTCLKPGPNDHNISTQHSPTLLAQHLQAPAKRSQHLNATYRNSDKKNSTFINYIATLLGGTCCARFKHFLHRPGQIITTHATSSNVA